MKRTKLCLMGIGIAALFLLAPQARAEMQSGLFRIHLDTPILGVGVGGINPDGPGGKSTFSGFQVGLGTPSMGLGLGGTLGKGFVLGGKATVAMAASDWYLADESEHFVWSLVPYIEYVFLQGLARPFVMGQLGFEGLHDTMGDVKYGWWSFLFGIGGGVHFMLSPKVSIDALLDLQQRFGTGRTKVGPIKDGFNHWRFSMNILLGLSIWL
ncbi:MAG: hypothetical protein M0R76_01190 [Proteobacteria bacterium]|nr:hypothetical protein [Pseudomonadota bacterium]